jgi:hypothetical protein
VALRAIGYRAVDTVPAEKGGQIAGPCTKITGSSTLRVVLGVVEDAEDIVNEVLGDGASHAVESIHKECDGISAVEVKR